MNKVSDVKKDEKRGKRACKKLPWRNKNGNEKQVNQEFTLDRTTVSMGNKSNDSGWPHFQDEDFIVFCFKENGAFDVVKDGKPEAFELFDSGNRSPRPVIRKDEEEQKSYLDVGSHSVASSRSYKFEEVGNHGMVSVESSDSNQSESSTGSFSFPILHWELTGSPEQMPISECQYTRKHKLTCAHFHCWKF